MAEHIVIDGVEYIVEDKPEYIVIEGPEGSGKSTVKAHIAKRLRQMGRTVVEVREPGGTIISERIRREVLLRTDDEHEPPMDYHTEFLLYTAARAQLRFEIIEPALRDGTTVLSDRSWYSSYAYQGFGRGIDLGFIKDVSQKVMGHLYTPDRAVIIDVETEVGLERVTASTPELDRWERERLETHKRVRSGYLDLARQFGNIAIVETTTLSIDEVKAETEKALGLIATCQHLDI